MESHHDRYKLWFQLSLKQQLNCWCDSLAKNAVYLSLSPTSPSNRNLRLPREHAAVYVRGVKQTSDVSKGVRFALGLVEAERFYTAPLGERDVRGRRRGGGLGWTKEAFHAVDWWALDITLAGKGQMYKQWLAK